MDVFEPRRKSAGDYRRYATSFVHIADDRIRQHADEELLGGLPLPVPLIPLHPAFAPLLILFALDEEDAWFGLDSFAGLRERKWTLGECATRDLILDRYEAMLCAADASDTL
jgi:hypothetical protein